MARTPDKILEACATIYAERSALYGNNHERVGPILNQLLPDVQSLQSPSDLLRLHLYSMLVIKMTRYGQQFRQGGHRDSLHDLIVYAAILQHFDEREAERRTKDAGART